VVDEHPRFHLDALRWFACLTEVAGVEPSDLVVHVVGTESSDALAYLSAQDVTVRPVDRFDPRSPHCNKISGALRLAEDGVGGMAVLCDTDLAVLEDPRRIALDGDVVAGKPVDAPVPPLDVLLAIFHASGVAIPPTIELPWGPDDRTVSGNNNGGLYLMPAPLLSRVAPAWANWARWLLDRAELLLEWTVYVDQVAMALGLAAEGIESVELDVRWNTPTHDPIRIPTDAPAPAIIHYHQEVDADGLLRVTDNQSIDTRIDVANEAIRRVWERSPPVRTHREWLRLFDAGPSPVVLGPDDRAILVELIEPLRPGSVLEVGLGNDVTGGLPFDRYSAIDESPEKLRRAALARPGGRFIEGSLAQHPTKAELTVCLDLVGRQSQRSSYETLVEGLWQSADRALVVSGWEHPAWVGDDAAVPFHEPLSTTLRRIAPGAEIYPVRVGRRATFVVLRPPMERHPRDYPATTLDPLIARHPDPLTLAAIRLYAWRTLRFYPDHSPRLWEYPVAAGLIIDALPKGSSIVDVGAGTTPLAPFLTSKGYVVDTVDPSPRRRGWPPEDDWNEWDFLDYQRGGLAHRSWNCTVDQLPSRLRFDGAYSISVIEHVPADDRRAMLAEMAARTRRGGPVVLTIDLVRGTDDLWNRNLGVEVEDPDVHGTLQDVIDEGARVGLELFRKETVRDWGDTHVDIGLLAMTQTAGRRRRHSGRGIRSKVVGLRSRPG
jgi:SAM-dependent methyltransferase